MENILKVASQNCRQNSITNINIKQLIQENDILNLQEVTIPKTDTNIIGKLEKEWKVKIYTSQSHTKNSIIQIVKGNLKETISFTEIIPGNATKIKISNEKFSYNIFNIYAPPGQPQEHIAFCKKLFEKLKYYENIILMGDFNNILNENECNKTRNEKHKKKARETKHLYQNLHDVHNILGSNLKYTYIVGDYRARLDKVLVEKNMIQNIENYEIIPTIFSDHHQIKIHLKKGEKIIKEVKKNKVFIYLD